MFRRILAAGAPLDQVEIAWASERTSRSSGRKPCATVAGHARRRIPGHVHPAGTRADRVQRLDRNRLRRRRHSVGCCSRATSASLDDEGFTAGQAGAGARARPRPAGERHYALALGALTASYEPVRATRTRPRRTEALRKGGRRGRACQRRLIRCSPHPRAGPHGAVALQAVVEPARRFLESRRARTRSTRAAAGALTNRSASCARWATSPARSTEALRFLAGRVERSRRRRASAARPPLRVEPPQRRLLLPRPPLRRRTRRRPRVSRSRSKTRCCSTASAKARPPALRPTTASTRPSTPCWPPGGRPAAARRPQLLVPRYARVPRDLRVVADAPGVPAASAGNATLRTSDEEALGAQSCVPERPRAGAVARPAGGSAAVVRAGTTAHATPCGAVSGLARAPAAEERAPGPFTSTTATCPTRARCSIRRARRVSLGHPARGGGRVPVPLLPRARPRRARRRRPASATATCGSTRSHAVAMHDCTRRCCAARDESAAASRVERDGSVRARSRRQLSDAAREMPPPSKEVVAARAREFLADLELFVEAEARPRSTRASRSRSRCRSAGRLDGQTEPLARREPVVDRPRRRAHVPPGRPHRSHRPDRPDGSFEVIDYKTGGYWPTLEGHVRGGHACCSTRSMAWRP